MRQVCRPTHLIPYKRQSNYKGFPKQKTRGGNLMNKYAKCALGCSLVLNVAFAVMCNDMSKISSKAFDDLAIAQQKVSEIQHDIEDLKTKQEVQQVEAK